MRLRLAIIECTAISALLLCVALSACGRAQAAPSALSAQSGTLQELRAFATNQLAHYDGQIKDPGYEYKDATFENAGLPGMSWFLFDIPATAAAVLGVQENNHALREFAIRTYNHAIAHQLPNGAFSGQDTEANVDSVGSTFFGAAFGVADLELRADLNRRTRAAWSRAIGRLADYLITSGDASFYINGNVNLRETEIMWLAYAITGQKRFLAEYHDELHFTMHPPQSRWPGYGLHISRSANGVAQAGYLAESNTGKDPGFDPNYTAAQLDTVTDLYVLTHDQSYLRLLDLLYNQIRPRISSDWILDAVGGSRDSFDEPMTSPAVSILAASGSRPGIEREPTSQLSQIEQTYVQSDEYPNINFYKGFQSDLAMPLLNQQWPHGMATMRRSPSP